MEFPLGCGGTKKGKRKKFSRDPGVRFLGKPVRRGSSGQNMRRRRREALMEQFRAAEQETG